MKKKIIEKQVEKPVEKPLEKPVEKQPVEKLDVMLAGSHTEIEKFKKLVKMSGKNIGQCVVEIITRWNKENAEKILKEFMQ